MVFMNIRQNIDQEQYIVGWLVGLGIKFPMAMGIYTYWLKNPHLSLSECFVELTQKHSLEACECPDRYVGHLYEGKYCLKEKYATDGRININEKVM